MTKVADIAFIGGEVETVSPDGPAKARAVAVKDGRIAAVGTEAEVQSWIGPSTEVVDIAGGALLPGFQDCHIHAVGGGLEQMRCSLAGVGVDQYRDSISSFAKAHPELAWIRGGGWNNAAAEALTRSLLDEMVPDRPAVIFDDTGENAWVNTRAIEVSGLDRVTDDPQDGSIVRDGSGEPVGRLIGRASDLVLNAIPPLSLEDLVEALRACQRALHASGITAWQDAGMGAWATGESVYDIGQDAFPAYLAADERGILTGRVVGAFWWERTVGEEQINQFVERREKAKGRFQATSVKIQQDGMVQRQTASMLEPYTQPSRGKPEDWQGESFVEASQLARYVARLDELGFQVHFHGIGDRADRECLDAVAAARKVNGTNDNRHHIAHVHVPAPIDVPRFAELGVIANFQPLWCRNDHEKEHENEPALGAARAQRQYPIGSLLRAGARVAFGSDWSWTSENPLWGIYGAVERMCPAGDLVHDLTAHAQPFLPNERIRLADALAGYTIGAAYANHLERLTGSIDIGKAADLVLLDRTLRDVIEGEGEGNVEMTFIDGGSVHERRA